MRIEGAHVLVTGAARGMGAHFARRLAELGARVSAGDVDEAGLAELPEAVARRRLDVADLDDVEAFVAWAREHHGPVDALINNAGILRDGLLVAKDRKTGALRRLSREDFEAVVAVNLTGATFMAQAAAAAMIEDGRRGVIVNMSSISRHGNRGQTNYVAAKAALAANTVTWARELAPYGIRVGAIAPGLVDTPMARSMPDRHLERALAAIPLGRMGTPEEIFCAVRFVLECDYFTGETIDVHGGLRF
ncbi:MAG: SDR family oxidoreductase [Deltaproteobacteria bacterium]|nr:MAG: SDR family oxidoreductase [Deltaproteobacteria bacterium]